MMKKMLFGALSAILFSMAVAPAAHASSIDIGPIAMTNVVDASGGLTGSTSGAIFNILGSPVNNFSIFNGSFAFAANFDTTTNTFTSGNFSLGGLLLDNSMTPIEAANLQGTFTGVAQTGSTLDFAFNITSSDPALAVFGSQGVLILKIPSAPPSFQLGGSFTATGISTADITAVPTPNAVFAGLLLLSGMAAFGIRRSLKLS